MEPQIRMPPAAGSGSAHSSSTQPACLDTRNRRKVPGRRDYCGLLEGAGAVGAGLWVRFLADGLLFAAGPSSMTVLAGGAAGGAATAALRSWTTSASWAWDD